ncbi:hypothetical protein ACQ86N_33560 [Puia sp. P3]|uniref:hypothetical protein n=1 Tax=Puia sp. P3 TaxID=3423952 RepID=UPI003D679CFE
MGVKPEGEMPVDVAGRGGGQDFSLVATPARHFSGRSLKRYQTLWSSVCAEDGRA